MKLVGLGLARVTVALVAIGVVPAVAAGGSDEVAGRDAQTQRSRVNIRLTGGFGTLGGGDVNDGVALWAESFESLLANEVVGLQAKGWGGVAALAWGTELGGDVTVGLTQSLAIVGSIGRLDAASEGAIEHDVIYERVRGTTRNSTSLGLRTVPLRIGLQYSNPIGERLSFAVEGGAGLYYTQVSWFHELDVDGRLSSWRSETRGHGIGIHGGVWLDVELSGGLGLVVGVEAVRADIGRLEGFREGTFTYRASSRDDGALSLASLGGSSFLVVGEGSWLRERYGPFGAVRGAKVDLSGLRLRGGLRFAL